MEPHGLIHAGPGFEAVVISPDVGQGDSEIGLARGVEVGEGLGGLQVSDVETEMLGQIDGLVTEVVGWGLTPAGRRKDQGDRAQYDSLHDALHSSVAGSSAGIMEAIRLEKPPAS